MLTNHQKSVGACNSGMKTINHVNSKKIKFSNTPNYLCKTLSSQAKIVEKNSKSRTRASSIMSKDRRSVSRSNTKQRMTISTSGKISQQLKKNRCLSVLSNDQNRMETAEHTGTIIHQDPTKTPNTKFRNLNYVKGKKNAISVLQQSGVTNTRNKSVIRKELFTSIMDRINARTEARHQSI